MKPRPLPLLVSVLAVAWWAAAVQAKPAHKPTKTKSGATAAAPPASAEEINKLKGEFKWGMNREEVEDKVAARIEETYAQRIEKSAGDPNRQDKIRKQLRAEIERAKADNYIKFDGKKTGYDVSIIDQEFSHGTGESMIATKEPNSTRYFFFRDEKLYKMFIAFDKEMVQDKSFAEFGELMQARFGKARGVMVEVKEKAGVKKKLDHFEWSAKSGDGLRLVDRSDFYDVYCLVIFDSQVAQQLAELRRSMGKPAKGDALVEAVTQTKAIDRDTNDDVIDRITGKEVRKPGDNREPQDVVVPSGVHGPSAAAVNARTSSGTKSTDESEGASAQPKGEGKAKDKGPGGKVGKSNRSAETQGLEL